VPHNSVDETFTVTLLPPGDSGFPRLAAGQRGSLPSSGGSLVCFP
jgi:hypothetical protein